MKAIVILALVGVISAAPSSDFKLTALIDDFADFLKLLPLDKMRAIAQDHLQNDAEFGDCVRFLQGPEWIQLVLTIHDTKQWQDFEAYMKTAGVDMHEVMASIQNFINDLKPGTNPGKEENVKGFFNDEVKLIPIDKLLELLDDKMKNSKDFKAFFDQISSPEAKSLVDEVRKMPEAVRMGDALIKMGIPVKEILELIYQILGWGEPQM